MAKQAGNSPLALEVDPQWLINAPNGAAPPPPTVTRATELPFNALSWRDFERLCRRLAQRRGEVEKAYAYGTEGQAQGGIDVLVRLANGAYEVWQAKRYKA